MQFYLFCGFLGSGKTTLTIELTKYIVQKKKKKVMLIVNDVGDIGIDAKLMKKLDTDVYELFGGCVCGQLGNLANLLIGIGEKYIVDLVIMEASGMAKPVNFIDTIRKFVPDGTEVKVITLADAERWFELHQVLEPLIESQINSANLVLVNKIDSVNVEEISNIVQDIKNIKSGVDILTISAFKNADILKVAKEVIGCAR